MQCPACGAAMNAHYVLAIEIDACPRCGGAWLDPGEAEARDVQTGALFGVGPGAAEFDRVSERKCPRHGRNMETFVATSGQRAFEVERADCCGGLFLDAGEGVDFAQAAARAAQMATHAQEDVSVREVARGLVAMGGAPTVEVAVRPLAPVATSARRCPRCAEPYGTDRSLGFGAFEVDLCPGCGSMFLDAGEGESLGVDTAALFGLDANAAVEVGPSSLPCPACAEPMTVIHVTTFAGTLEVDRAHCCGGLYLDGGELDPLCRAAKRARNEIADQVYAEKGEYVGEAGMIKAMANASTTRAVNGMIRGRVDSMVQRMLEQRMRRRHRRDHEFGFD